MIGIFLCNFAACNNVNIIRNMGIENGIFKRAELLLGEDVMGEIASKRVIPSASAACHCPLGTANTPARIISAIDEEVKNVRPIQSAKNSGEREAPPSIANPCSSGLDHPPKIPKHSQAAPPTTSAVESEKTVEIKPV